MPKFRVRLLLAVAAVVVLTFGLALPGSSAQAPKPLGVQTYQVDRVITAADLTAVASSGADILEHEDSRVLIRATAAEARAISAKGYQVTAVANQTPARGPAPGNSIRAGKGRRSSPPRRPRRG